VAKSFGRRQASAGCVTIAGMAARASGLSIALAAILALTLGVGSTGVSARRGDASGNAGLTAAIQAAAPALPRWTGGVNLYRPGVFSTQKTWSWCTAAGVQIMRNIVLGRSDHSRASQQRYFAYMRRHDRYAIPVSDGTDPAGWSAGLRRWVDPRYRIVAKRSFKGALRSAVTRLRKTNLPVAIAVAHGNHAWVLTGFTATADPARTERFKVRSVRVTGPLWGRQSRAYGYDMRPNRRLTPGQLEGFFTPWHYPRVRMAWEGRWVSIQPIGR
jgi:hypothetical protein